jgi:pimeloyl-ACP methyl ester carboxylesterase
MTSFGEQVIALLDHLGAEQAVIGGTSLGANVSLEVAVIAPERVKGLVVEMPVLNHALVAGILAFVPIMLAARYLPFTANLIQRASRSVPRGIVPFWTGVALDTVDHRADSIASVLHGVIFGRLAPSSSQRRRIHAPVFLVGHPIDPIHPFVDADMLAAELPNVRFERASSILEWRFRPERLTTAAADFAFDCWRAGAAAGTTRARKR